MALEHLLAAMQREAAARVEAVGHEVLTEARRISRDTEARIAERREVVIREERIRLWQDTHRHLAAAR